MSWQNNQQGYYNTGAAPFTPQGYCPQPAGTNDNNNINNNNIIINNNNQYNTAYNPTQNPYQQQQLYTQNQYQQSQYYNNNYNNYNNNYNNNNNRGGRGTGRGGYQPQPNTALNPQIMQQYSNNNYNNYNNNTPNEATDPTTTTTLPTNSTNSEKTGSEKLIIKDAKNDPKLQPRGLVTKTTEPFVMPKKKGKSGVLNLGAKKPEVASPTDNNNNNNNNNTPVTPNEETPAIASPITPTDPNNNNNNNNNQLEKKPPTEVQNTLKSPEILREELRREILKKKSGKDYIRDPRPHYSIVFCGHVDAGKSTLSGRLLHSFGLVDEREMDKIKREAAVNKREGWEYAYVLDVSEEERAKGKTHEVGAAYFETEKRRITILDAPGHKAFVPSMIGGAMQAEVAIMVISARTGEFETGFEKGGQTREHTMLVRTCGVKHLICVVNKMDETSEGGGGSGQWNKDRFDEIMGKLRPFFKSNGYDENNNNNGDSSSSLIVIPVASLAGQNLTSRVTDDICPWYNGPSLIEAINNLKLVDTRREDDVLAVPIVGAVKDDGKMIISGKCESGSIEIGEKLQILPSKQEITVEGILIENTELDKCYPGDNIQLKVKGINDDSEIKGGYVITSIPTSLKASEFIQARVVVLDVKNILSAGSRLMMHIHTAQEEVIIDKILATIDKKTGAVLEKEPSCVKAGCTIMVRLELERALVVDTHTSFDKMARFMLRSEGKTVALGLVTRLYESTKDKIKRGN